MFRGNCLCKLQLTFALHWIKLGVLMGAVPNVDQKVNIRHQMTYVNHQMMSHPL